MQAFLPSAHLPMAGRQTTTRPSQRMTPTLLFLATLLTSGVLCDWTVVLGPAEVSTYESCISQHSGNTGECWVAWTETTVTVPPSTVVSDVFVSVTATLISVLPATTPPTRSSISSPPLPPSTVTVSVPLETSSTSASAKTIPASRTEKSRPFLFLALSLFLLATWRLVGA
jgi:hypothetical protein